MLVLDYTAVIVEHIYYVGIGLHCSYCKHIYYVGIGLHCSYCKTHLLCWYWTTLQLL